MYKTIINNNKKLPSTTYLRIIILSLHSLKKKINNIFIIVLQMLYITLIPRLRIIFKINLIHYVVIDSNNSSNDSFYKKKIYIYISKFIYYYTMQEINIMIKLTIRFIQ